VVAEVAELPVHGAGRRAPAGRNVRPRQGRPCLGPHGAGRRAPAGRSAQEVQKSTTPDPCHRRVTPPDPGRAQGQGRHWWAASWGTGPAKGTVEQYLQEETATVAGPPCQWETERIGQGQVVVWWRWRRGIQTHQTPHGER
jgi:hypothetical protein